MNNMLTRLRPHSNWKWPDIPGLESFNGDLVHSAAWKENFNYQGKRVAVIGNGSSGVQIVPAIQPGVHEKITTRSTLHYLWKFRC
jgi:cation diffusion facilitator CzcD-associated flavoprotein CzcO